MVSQVFVDVTPPVAHSGALDPGIGVVAQVGETRHRYQDAVVDAGKPREGRVAAASDAELTLRKLSRQNCNAQSVNSGGLVDACRILPCACRPMTR